MRFWPETVAVSHFASEDAVNAPPLIAIVCEPAPVKVRGDGSKVSGPRLDLAYLRHWAPYLKVYDLLEQLLAE